MTRPPLPPPALIDSFMPRYDVRERHRIRVSATAEATYAALRTTDLARAWPVRALLFVRALPAAVLGGTAGLRALRASGSRERSITLAEFERRGFRVIADDPPRELVIGLEGRFWRANGALCTVTSEQFRTLPPAPGSARAVWNFTVRDAGAGGDAGVELATETRVLCADAATRRRFCRTGSSCGRAAASFAA